MRTVRSGRGLSVVLFAFSTLLLYGQDSQPPPAASEPPTHPVMLMFQERISSASINNLLARVNEQVNKGVHKITILINSEGGETSAAFFAYNVLKGMQNVEISTFNLANIDSAAIILYCAGDKRYSVPGPGPRFLIHSNAIDMVVGIPVEIRLDPNTLDADLQQLKTLNQITAHVITAIAPSKTAEVEKAFQSQLILTPEQARDWGIVTEIKKSYTELGAVLIAVDSGPNRVPKSPEVRSLAQ